MKIPPPGIEPHPPSRLAAQPLYCLGYRGRWIPERKKKKKISRQQAWYCDCCVSWTCKFLDEQSAPAACTVPKRRHKCAQTFKPRRGRSQCIFVEIRFRYVKRQEPRTWETGVQYYVYTYRDYRKRIIMFNLSFGKNVNQSNGTQAYKSLLQNRSQSCLDQVCPDATGQHWTKSTYRDTLKLNNKRSIFSRAQSVEEVFGYEMDEQRSFPDSSSN